MQKALQLVLGIVAGAALAGLGLWLGRPADAGELTPTQPGDVGQTTAAPQPSEMIATTAPLGSATVIPTDLEVDGTTLVLHFELEDRAPPILGYEVDRSRLPGFRLTPNTEFGVVAPEFWTLRTSSGDEIPGTTANIRARTARFTVPEGFDMSSVVSIHLDTYRQRVPHVVDVSFDTSKRETVKIDPQTTVTLDTILEQSNGITFRFAVEYPFDGFSTSGNVGMDNVNMFGHGPNWVSAGPWEQGIQMTYGSTELPATIEITVDHANWVEFDVDVDIPLQHLTGEAP